MFFPSKAFLPEEPWVEKAHPSETRGVVENPEVTSPKDSLSLYNALAALFLQDPIEPIGQHAGQIRTRFRFFPCIPPFFINMLHLSEQDQFLVTLSF